MFVVPFEREFFPDRCNLFQNSGQFVNRMFGRQSENNWRQRVDCSSFRPQDIKVDAIDGQVKILAVREEIDGRNSNSHRMTRVYDIPDHVDTDTVRSYLTDNGMLIIEGKRRTNERVIPVCGDEIWKPLEHEVSTVEVDGKKCFKASANLNGFKPSVLKVTCRDNQITIKAEQENKKDGFSSFRKFTKTFSVPPNANVDDLKSSMDADGILTIMTPLTEDRDIPISVEIPKDSPKENTDEAE